MKNVTKLVLTIVIATIAGCGQKQIQTDLRPRGRVLFMETFEDEKLWSYPVRWNKVTKGAEQIICNDCPGNNSKTFQLQTLRQWKGTHSANIIHYLPNVIALELKVFVENEYSMPWAGFISIEPKNRNEFITGFVFLPDSTIVWKSGKKQYVLQKYSPKKTYRLRAEINFRMNAAWIYVNGKRVGNALPITRLSSISALALGEAGFNSSGISSSYFDDILLEDLSIITCLPDPTSE